MKKLSIASVALALALSGCATRSEDIPAAYISPVQYSSFSCRQITEEAARLSARASQATAAQDKKANHDAAGMAIGLLVLWPMLLFNEGDGAEAAEVSRLKGEMEALEQASIQKNCNITFATAKPVEKVAAKKAEPVKRSKD